MSENKGTNASNALREKLEGIRNRLFVKYGEKGMKRLSIIIPSVIFAVILLVLLFFFFPIRRIEVTGDVRMFNESDIIAAAEVDVGDSFFLNSSGSIKRALEKNLPLAETVKVKKTLFGKVKIEVKFREAEYFAKSGDKYFAFDKDLLVVSISETGSKFSAYGAVYVLLPEIREVEVGKRIVFYDTVEETNDAGESLYEVKEEKYYDYVSEYLTALKKSGFHADADAVDLREKFDITLIYAEKFRVRFGYLTDLERKFNIFFKMLEEGTLQNYDKVTVDLSIPAKPIARPDALFDIDEYLK